MHLSRLHRLCNIYTRTLAKLRAHINGLRVLARSDVRIANSTLAVHSLVLAGVCSVWCGTSELLSVKFDRNLFHPQVSSPARQSVTNDDTYYLTLHYYQARSIMPPPPFEGGGGNHRTLTPSKDS